MFKTHYFGKTLKEAKEYALADRDLVFDTKRANIRSIKLDKKAPKTKVEWSNEAVKRYIVTFVKSPLNWVRV